MNWEHTITKLQRLRELDARFTLFGSNIHRYRLGAPLTEAQVHAFETAYNVTLPPEYRTFLLQVGNGGAGPYYGLLPLGQDQEALPLLAAPFPHTQEWNDFLLHNDDYFAANITQGAMRICNSGEGGYELLIVSGPLSGTIWADGRYVEQGLLPLAGQTGQNMNFWTWYNDWIDYSISTLEDQV
jgi:hypothetical protein